MIPDLVLQGKLQIAKVGSFLDERRLCGGGPGRGISQLLKERVGVVPSCFLNLEMNALDRV